MGLQQVLSAKRSSLTLLHPTSLPDPEGRAYGIGELGSEAFRFIDFLVESGTRAWQVLPLGHTGFKDSPYQTFSRYAGSPHIISIERLLESGDLSAEEHDAYCARVRDEVQQVEKADFGWLFARKLGARLDSDAVLREAFRGFGRRDSGDPRREAFELFCQKNGQWLRDYADYMGIKEWHDHRGWPEWSAPFRDVEQWKGQREEVLEQNPALAEAITCYEYFQFVFFEQWNALHAYAKKNNRLLIGDTPWYVGHDSADVWARPHVFDLDEMGLPTHFAGVPPDYFSEDGQLWGNPLYDWACEESFEWWADSISFLLETVDILRIDHFRAADTYWKIPREQALETNSAKDGLWAKGPGVALLERIRARLIENGRLGEADPLPMIAEDLGGLDPLYQTLEKYPEYFAPQYKYRLDAEFQQMIADCHADLGHALNVETGEYSARVGVDIILERFDLPWMSVAQFGFENAERYRYQNAPEECVLYTGTHDNNTAMGWFHRITQNGAHPHDSHLAGEILHELYQEYDSMRRTPHERDNGSREINWDLIELVLKSRALLCGAPFQDYLGLGDEGRMNLPGDNGGWWTWRVQRDAARDHKIATRLRELNSYYGRCS